MVGVSERLGSETLINLNASDGTTITAVLPEDVELQEGRKVQLNIDTNKIHVFPV